jgi:hypothetical protein
LTTADQRGTRPKPAVPAAALLAMRITGRSLIG